MTFIVTKGGGLQETGAKEIPLEFNKENLKLLLDKLISNDQTYTHQDFSNWAGKFHVFCIDSFDKGKLVDANLEEILNDIEAQWSLFLFNSYNVEELLKLDLSTVKLPSDLLTKWQNILHAI